jgi:hypothetical protein
MKEMVENVEGEGSRRTDKGEEEEEEESSVLSPISVEYEPLGVHRSVPYRNVPYRLYCTVQYLLLACACIYKAASYFRVYLTLKEFFNFIWRIFFPS